MERLEIRRSSAVDQVADAVRKMILCGDLPPGTALREAQVAESIGISRNTVRDAMRSLAREGLVTHSMHRGAVVTRLTVDDVVDVYRVRRSIETQAVEASRDATPEQIAGLGDAIRDLERAAEDEDRERMVEADCAFHQRLVALLGSPRLDRFYDTIQGELRLCLAIVDQDEGDADLLVAEHRDLFQMIADGRVAECIQRLDEVLVEAEVRLLRLFAEGEEEDDR